jgi:hypothetical protein
MTQPILHAVAADHVFDGAAVHEIAAVIVDDARILQVVPQVDVPRTTQWRGLDRLAQKGDAKAAGALFQGGFMQPMSDRSREPIMAAQGVGDLGPDAARTAASSAGRSLRE